MCAALRKVPSALNCYFALLPAPVAARGASSSSSSSQRSGRRRQPALPRGAEGAGGGRTGGGEGSARSSGGRRRSLARTRRGPNRCQRARQAGGEPPSARPAAMLPPARLPSSLLCAPLSASVPEFPFRAPRRATLHFTSLRFLPALGCAACQGWRLHVPADFSGFTHAKITARLESVSHLRD